MNECREVYILNQRQEEWDFIHEKYILHGIQSYRKLHNARNIQILQVGIPVLPTSWLQHLHSTCRRQFWSSEEPNRVPNRRATNKSVRRKLTCP